MGKLSIGARLHRRSSLVQSNTGQFSSIPFQFQQGFPGFSPDGSSDPDNGPAKPESAAVAVPARYRRETCSSAPALLRCFVTGSHSGLIADQCHARQSRDAQVVAMGLWRESAQQPSLPVQFNSPRLIRAGSVYDVVPNRCSALSVLVSP